VYQFPHTLRGTASSAAAQINDRYVGTDGDATPYHIRAVPKDRLTL